MDQLLGSRPKGLVTWEDYRGVNWLAAIGPNERLYIHDPVRPGHDIRPIDASGNALPGTVFGVSGLFGGMRFNKQGELFYVDTLPGSLYRAALRSADGTVSDEELLIDDLKFAMDLEFVPSLSERLDFDEDGQLTLADADEFYDAVDTGTDNHWLDLDHGGHGDDKDLYDYITEVIGATAGDTNLNHTFDSDDLVRALTAGQYEDDITRNSTWDSGDWNSDREFQSDDLVAAFQTGEYEIDNPVTESVPEPF